jgi:hypothetical protein
MKNISSMLYRGNLTPTEKFILLIQNDVQKAKTGKDILTPADKDALENWKAQNNSEAREWNRLNEAWKHNGRMEIELEFIYKDARIAYLANLPILMKLLYYPAYQKMGKCIDTLERIKTVELDEAVRITSKQCMRMHLAKRVKSSLLCRIRQTHGSACGTMVEKLMNHTFWIKRASRFLPRLTSMETKLHSYRLIQNQRLLLRAKAL